MLVARAENYLHGRPDLDDTIRRLQAYEAAGAEVLYAPGITQPDDIRAVCSAVKKPVNVLMGMKGAPPLSVKELGELGVRRISLGSGFCRAALTAFLHAAREVIDDGTFTFAEQTLYMSELADLFKKKRSTLANQPDRNGDSESQRQGSSYRWSPRPAQSPPALQSGPDSVHYRILSPAPDARDAILAQPQVTHTRWTHKYIHPLLQRSRFLSNVMVSDPTES